MAVGGGVWWYRTEGPGAYTTVPDGILDVDLATATAALVDADLEVASDERFHPTAPEGDVVDSSAFEGETSAAAPP